MTELLTAAQMAMRRVPVVNDPNTIPPMTNPMGQHWRQPDRSRVLIDDAVAVMSKADADTLPNYSHTIPTGAYEGKMWKAEQGGKVWLCWYGYSDKPDHVSINTRELLTT